MKILDIPQSGKRGLAVSQGGRFGQISRALVIPSNPRTAAQIGVRAILAACAQAWSALTEDKRTAWTAAAKNVSSTPRCGTSGTLTGNQLYTKLNAVLMQLGLAPVDVPPLKPAFSLPATTALTATNAGGVVTLKLGCPGALQPNTVVEASGPQAPGREVCNDFRVLGILPQPAQGSCDITDLYTARYGTPPAGAKLFVRVYNTTSGWKSQPVQTSGVIPAAA